MPQLLQFIQQENAQLSEEIKRKSGNDDTFEDLISLLASSGFQKLMDEFVASNKNPNFKFWWEYIQMAEILLHFICAQQNGNWELHLFAFRSILPYFMRYNHTNYKDLS